MSAHKNAFDILNLPIELIIEIFNYIPDRRSLSIVCQKFYQIICFIESNWNILSIKDEHSLLNNQTFSSMISSHRNIKTLKINVGANCSDLFWGRFEAIILKLRYSIESLDITFTDIPQTLPKTFRLINILHLLPFECPKSFKITNLDVNYVDRFISSRNIKELTIVGGVRDVQVFNRLDLSSLNLIAPKCNINEVIMLQENLRSFKLVADESTTINSQTLSLIKNLDKLKEIDIPLINLDCYECIETFQSMKSLKNLSFQSSAEFALEFCNSAVFDSITDLDISVPSELLHENIFENVKFTFPGLKSLGIRTPMALKIFKSLCVNSLICFEALLVENIFYGFVGITILDLNDRNIIQKAVRRLILINHDRKVIICKNDLLKLLKLFPNLECLVLSGYFDTQNYLESLLKSMKCLKEIVIVSSASHSTTHIMGIIKEHGIHLRLIVLENFKSACDVDNLKTFFDDHFPVIEKKNANLVLRKSGLLKLKDFC